MAGELTHGSRYTYVKLKCRCDLCKDANAEYKRNKTAYYASLQASDARQNTSSDAQSILGELTHGLPSTYEWYQCRCSKCEEAYQEALEYRRFMRSMKV